MADDEIKDQASEETTTDTETMVKTTTTPQPTTREHTAPRENEAPKNQQSDEEPFDRDRAMKTIANMRGYEKQAKDLERSNRDQQKRIQEFETREKEAEMAKLSEQERLSKQLAERDAELIRVRHDHQDRTNRYEVQLHAAKLGLVDPEAAVKLLDWGFIDYAADGKPQNVEAALNELVEAKPWLKAAQETPKAERQARSAATTNPSTHTPAPGSRTYSVAEMGDYQFYLANKKDITLAVKEGRITA